MLDQQQDQHVEDFETTETEYSTIVHNVVSMLASLIRHQMKDYHRIHFSPITSLIFVRICLATRKMFSLLFLTLANFSFSAFLLAV